MNKNNVLVVVCGPTASGKTALAIQLAQQFKTEVLSADSRQFYKEIPIGTATPTAEELSMVPHHFVGNLSITEEYNAGKFEQDALKVLDKLFKKHNVMISVGGAGMYIDALCNGFDDLPEVDPNIRNYLNKQLKEKGIESLQKKLEIFDSEYFEIVDKNNPQRIIRALEVCISTDKTYTSFLKREKKERPFHILKLGLDIEREKLYETINKRVDVMFERGLVEEAQSVYPQKELNALNTVGYSELFRHFAGELSLEQAKFAIKQNSRRYAKRQLTWFRRDEEIHWFKPFQLIEMFKLIEQYAPKA
jgi:tRNA dimethylallyltransferase